MLQRAPSSRSSDEEEAAAAAAIVTHDGDDSGSSAGSSGEEDEEVLLLNTTAGRWGHPDNDQRRGRRGPRGRRSRSAGRSNGSGGGGGGGGGWGAQRLQRAVLLVLAGAFILYQLMWDHVYLWLVRAYTHTNWLFLLLLLTSGISIAPNLSLAPRIHFPTHTENNQGLHHADAGLPQLLYAPRALGSV